MTEKTIADTELFQIIRKEILQTLRKEKVWMKVGSFTINGVTREDIAFDGNIDLTNLSANLTEKILEHYVKR